MFQKDPFTVIVYSVALATSIPLALILSRTYHLKETVSNILGQYLLREQKKEKSILTSLSELVLVTDINLNIISANEAVEKALRLPVVEMIHKPLLSVLPLFDKDGNVANGESLSINQAFTNKVTYYVRGFTLQPKGSQMNREVTVQISPLSDPDSHISEVVFVITDSQSSEECTHTDLAQAHLKYKSLVEKLKKNLLAYPYTKVQKELSLINKIEEDLVTAFEIKDHPFRGKKSLQDLFFICRQVVDLKQNLARSFNVDLDVSSAQNLSAEEVLMSLKHGGSAKAVPGSYFASPVDAKWLDLILQKLIDIAILLSSSSTKPSVRLAIERKEKFHEIKISLPFRQLTKKEQDELFEEYYGSLSSNSNLSLGSGLEGFIAKTVASQLNIFLTVNSTENNLVLSLQLPQTP